MTNREQDQDWARQVPNRREKSPYEDWGWDSGESGLPEFRDPSVHLTPREQRRVREWQRRNEEAVRRSQNQMYGRRQAWDDESDLDDDFVYYEEDYYYPQDYGYNGPLNSPKIYPGRQNLNRGEDWTMPGPHTGHGPRGYRRSDERIKEDVCERLTRHGYLDASDIDVDVKDGEVTLRGSVSSRRAKRMAEDTAETVSGVWDVHNELHLSNLQSGGQGRRDEVGHSGVFPASGGSAPGDAEAHGMASWGQGERGAAGYEDSGRSELHLDKPSGDQS